MSNDLKEERGEQHQIGCRKRCPANAKSGRECAQLAQGQQGGRVVTAGAGRCVPWVVGGRGLSLFRMKLTLANHYNPKR